jgi:hypothetical protein
MVKKNDKELGMQKLERISQDLHSFYVIIFITRPAPISKTKQNKKMHSNLQTSNTQTKYSQVPCTNSREVIIKTKTQFRVIE